MRRNACAASRDLSGLGQSNAARPAWGCGLALIVRFAESGFNYQQSGGAGAGMVIRSLIQLLRNLIEELVSLLLFLKRLREQALDLVQ
jgi:hypothetical protein